MRTYVGNQLNLKVNLHEYYEVLTSYQPLATCTVLNKLPQSNGQFRSMIC